MITLKGGYTAKDSRLGRVPQFDERSKQYPIRTLVTQLIPRSYTWSCLVNLDQAQTPDCVGFSWAQELAARPVVIPSVTNAKGITLYKMAQQLDEWPGEDYEGSSVLGGAKAVQQLGYMKEYRWAFGLDDLIMGVGHNGPAILGINWLEDMFSPDPTGLISVSGAVAGGHAILCNGVSITKKLFRLHNSWSSSWGANGDCFVTFDDMDKLLKDQGEACFPVNRVNIGV